MIANIVILDENDNICTTESTVNMGFSLANNGLYTVNCTKVELTMTTDSFPLIIKMYTHGGYIRIKNIPDNYDNIKIGSKIYFEPGAIGMLWNTDV